MSVSLSFVLLLPLTVQAATAGRVVQCGLLAAGSPWETPWYEVDTGIDGPVLFVTGGMHGNEPAGYRAAEQIRHWPIIRGRMIVVPQLNKLGLAANQRLLPTFEKEKKLCDANDNFPKASGPDEAETLVCQELWTLARQHQPTCVIDLHEGFDFRAQNPKSVGSSVLFLETPHNKPLATAMLKAVNTTVEEKERRFVRLGRTGPAQGSFVRSSIDRLGCEGYILETTFKQQPISLRARQHRIMVSTLLLQLGMLDQICADILAPELPEDVHHVGLYDGPGTGEAGVKRLSKIFDEDPRFQLHLLGPGDLQTADLSRFSLLIFPGGSGSRQAEAIGEEAGEKVRTFVKNGGGYMGICAGAYLCSSHYKWSLNLVDTKVFTGSREVPGEGRKQMWHRGPGAAVKMELTEEGRKILGDWEGIVSVRYQNGPIVSPAGRTDLPTYLPLAHFRSEVSAWEPQKGTMVDTPAIVAGNFGEGRVISISPHPEATEALQPLVLRAAAWAAGLVTESTLPMNH